MIIIILDFHPVLLNLQNDHTPATLSGPLASSRLGALFAFRTAFIHLGIEPTMSWKPFSEVLSILTRRRRTVAADLSAERP